MPTAIFATSPRQPRARQRPIPKMVVTVGIFANTQSILIGCQIQSRSIWIHKTPPTNRYFEQARLVVFCVKAAHRARRVDPVKRHFAIKCVHFISSGNL